MAQIGDARFCAISDAEASMTDKEIKKLLKQYEKRMHDIDKEIKAQVSEIAINNNVSNKKAREMLKKQELQEFQWDVEEYISKAVENETNGKWINELINASNRANILRLEAAKYQIGIEIDKLYSDIDSAHTKISKNAYTTAYLQTAFSTQEMLETFSTFAKPNTGKIHKLAAAGWASDGKSYSDRIWENRKKVASAIETELTNAAIRGDSVDKTVKNLSEKIKQNVPKSYIERLVRTESTYMATSGQLDSYQELGADGVRFVTSLDESTCKTCGPLDGKIYKFDEANPGQTVPPVHPNCRCTLAPWYGDGLSDNENKKRTARDPITGKSVDVPDMVYEDWKKIFVDKTKKLADWIDEQKKLKVQPTKKPSKKTINEILQEMADLGISATYPINGSDYSAVFLSQTMTVSEWWAKIQNNNASTTQTPASTSAPAPAAQTAPATQPPKQKPASMPAQSPTTASKTTQSAQTTAKTTKSGKHVKTKQNVTLPNGSTVEINLIDGALDARTDKHPNAAFQAYNSEMMQDLTKLFHDHPTIKEAFYYYTGGNYGCIHRCEHGYPDQTIVGKYGKTTVEQSMKYATIMRKAIKSIRNTKPFLTVRGFTKLDFDNADPVANVTFPRGLSRRMIGHLTDNDMISIKKQLVGTKYTTADYLMSTSLKINTAQVFTGLNRIVGVFKVPESTGVGIFVGHISQYSSEAEVILAPSTEWIVTDVYLKKDNSDQYLVIEYEMK